MILASGCPSLLMMTEFGSSTSDPMVITELKTLSLSVAAGAGSGSLRPHAPTSTAVSAAQVIERIGFMGGDS